MQEIGKLMHNHSFECGYNDKSTYSKKQNNDFVDSENENFFSNLVSSL